MLDAAFHPVCPALQLLRGSRLGKPVSHEHSP